MRTYTLTLAALLMAAGSIFMLTSFSGPEEDNTRATNGGEISFTVRTVSAGGNYSPKHVLAIWIEDLNGFVKSRKVMAVQRKQYLYTWISSSNYNTVDAITGSTISNHQTHTIEWDCTDLNGDIVPDGDYVVWVEFTDRHAQGPLYSLTFTKGPDPQFLTPADETYFKDLVLTFTPLVCEFSADLTDICQEDHVIFTDESVNATSWEWSFGEGALPATANTQGPHDVKYAESGKKIVSLTINGALTETKVDFINVNVKPLADFMYSGSGLTVMFSNASVSADGYHWDFGDGNASTEENPEHTYASAGSYLVNLVASSLDCSDTVVQEIMVPMVGLSENEIANQVRIFPNPNNGKFYIELQNFKETNSIRMMDMSGKLVKTILNNTPDNALITVDLSGAESGIYFLEVVSGTDVSIRRVVIR